MSPGQTIDVERLDVAEGDTVELERVLLIADGDRLTVGKPTIQGAKVIVTSKGEGKGKKIIVFKYKSKVRYSKKTGHRQLYTRLTIDKISEPEAAQGEPQKKARRRKKEVAENGTEKGRRLNPLRPGLSVQTAWGEKIRRPDGKCGDYFSPAAGHAHPPGQ